MLTEFKEKKQQGSRAKWFRNTIYVSPSNPTMEYKKLQRKQEYTRIVQNIIKSNPQSEGPLFVETSEMGDLSWPLITQELQTALPYRDVLTIPGRKLRQGNRKLDPQEVHAQITLKLI